jgi:hypothetical protein
MRITLQVFTALLLSLWVMVPAQARKAVVPTQPGNYEDWNEDIAKVEIKQTFKLTDFSEVLVTVDTSTTPLPEKDDNTFEPVTLVLKTAQQTFIDGMRDQLSAPAIKAATADASPTETTNAMPPPVLQLRVRLLRVNPGSRAARYFGSFGAGKSSVEIEGEILDGTSNTVLLSFATQRSSGGIMKFAGGSYEKLLNGDIKDLGSDIGAVLTVFK